MSDLIMPKTMREYAYKELLIEYRRRIKPNAVMNDLKKLLHEMWSSYRMELKRKLLDKVYKPRLWYFDALDNLRKEGAEYYSGDSEEVIFIKT